MKKTCAIALLLICLLAQSALAAVSERVLARAVDIIGTQESNHNYGLVITDTNGKISAGFLQWNAGRAASLVKKAIEASGRDISFDGTLSASDKTWVSEILSSEAGKKVQDAQARADVSGYIEKAMSLGIQDPSALCYYADIAHQVGSGAIAKYHKLAAEKAGGYEKVTLEHLYQAALNYATHTKARRTRVYKLLKENPIQGSGQTQENPSQPQQATAVAISPAGAQTLLAGETLSLKAVFAPEAALEAVKWSSSNKKAATVDDGLVTAVKPGKTYIRVKSKSGLTARIKLTVKAAKVESMELSGEERMKKGDKQTLAVSFSPQGAISKVKWRSGNKKVAKVDQQGQVTAVKAGKAVIYCREAGGKTARFTLRVEKS